MNEGFGKDFYRKDNSVKRSGPFSESSDSENSKNCCPHPLPKISSRASSVLLGCEHGALGETFV